MTKRERVIEYDTSGTYKQRKARVREFIEWRKHSRGHHSPVVNEVLRRIKNKCEYIREFSRRVYRLVILDMRQDME